MDEQCHCILSFHYICINILISLQCNSNSVSLSSRLKPGVYSLTPNTNGLTHLAAENRIFQCSAIISLVQKACQNLLFYQSLCMISVSVIHMPLWILLGCSHVLCHILAFKEMLYDQYNSERTEIRHESHFRISRG